MDFFANIDWTAIVVAIIGIIFALAANALRKYLIPWLEERNLTNAAIVAVNAAEAVFGRYNGEEKFRAALKTLGNQGWNMDSEAVINAIKAAWQQLDLQMQDAGAKQCYIVEEYKNEEKAEEDSAE